MSNRESLVNFTGAVHFWDIYIAQTLDNIVHNTLGIISSANESSHLTSRML